MMLSGNIEKKQTFKSMKNTLSDLANKKTMSKKVTISSSKTFASNKALINTRSKLPTNPIPMRAYPIGTKINENAKDTDKSTSIENNGKNYGDNSKLHLSTISSGHNSTNSGDIRQKNKSLRYKDSRPGLQEIESLYDDYLVSELMRMNAERNCSITCKKINDEALNMWSSIEILRGDVLKLQESNELNQNMLEFYNAANSESPIIGTNITKKFPETSKKLKELADALEQSRHHLKVLGATIHPNEDTETPLLNVLSDALSQLSLLSNTEQDNDAYNNTATQISQLNIDFENSISAFDNCKDLLKRLRTSTLHATSLMLSKHAFEETVKKDDNIEPFGDFNYTKCAMEDLTCDDA